MSVESGYVAYIEEIPSVFGQGATIEEARAHLLAGMELWLMSNRRVTLGTFERPVVRRETIATVQAVRLK